MKLELFNKYYQLDACGQGTYLLSLINLQQAKRHKNTGVEVRDTVYYSIPNGYGTLLRVCKKTFMEIFSVGRKRMFTIISKKKEGHVTFIDERTSHKEKKYTQLHENMVVMHIMRLPKEGSHYTRHHSSREYMSPDLNFHRLYQAYNKLHPNVPVSYKFYKSTFLKRFPNLSFKQPRTDTCKICDKLNCLIKAKHINAVTHLEIHHRKAEAATQAMTEDIASSQLPGSDLHCISIDMQQVMFVPTLVHSEMFYRRQLSCYNFCIHLSNNNESYMCMWNESLGGRGGNEIASCIMKFVNAIALPKKDILTIWSDNCAGQNKNRMVLFILILLVTLGHFKQINHKFLMSGHSFLPCDRDFGVIEKRKKRCKSFVPEDLQKMVSTARTYPPFFNVISMDQINFLDIEKAADNIINTKKLNISKAVWLRIESEDPGVIHTKETFSEVEAFKPIKVWKQGKGKSDLINLNLEVSTNTLQREKKSDLMAMIDYLDKEEHKDYYRKLCT